MVIEIKNKEKNSLSIDEDMRIKSAEKLFSLILLMWNLESKWQINKIVEIINEIK